MRLFLPSLSKRQISLLSYFALILYGLLLLLASVLPVPEADTSVFSDNDKLVHFLLYGFLAALIFLCLQNTDDTIASGAVCLYSAAASSFYGILLECCQYFLPYRSFDILDIGANTAGALVVSCFFLLFRRVL